MEVGVASTKNVIAQVAVLLTMALSLGLKKNLQYADARALIEELGGLTDDINAVLMNAPKIREVAKKYSQYKSMFVL